MIHGLDTGILVAFELAEHPQHSSVRSLLKGLSDAGDRFAMAPQVVAEFVHIVTDARRFTCPLSMLDALTNAEGWWSSAEIDRVLPADSSVRECLSLLRRFGLGRKRVLDTLLAATYEAAGIHSLITTNPHDYQIFSFITCISP